jgi:hypothetical protein
MTLKTLQVSNGDLVIDGGTGGLLYAGGINKASQDVARAILIEYNSFFNEGNELINISGNKIQSLSELAVRSYLFDAIDRLILQEEGTNSTDRVVAVNTINTKIVGSSTVVFYIDVLFASGTRKSIVQGIDLKATELYQVDPTRGIIAI